MNKLRSKRKRIHIIAFACALLSISCGTFVTITDTYYIANETNDKISLVLDRSIAWDTCATETVHRVWFNTNTIQIDAGKTVRLHPVKRKFSNHIKNHYWNVISVIGPSAQLIADMDTIIWQVERNNNGTHEMFTSDKVWSIYNTENWQNRKDSERPDTYYHTFAITSDKIERNKQ